MLHIVIQGTFVEDQAEGQIVGRDRFHKFSESILIFTYYYDLACLYVILCKSIQRTSIAAFQYDFRVLGKSLQCLNRRKIHSLRIIYSVDKQQPAAVSTWVYIVQIKVYRIFQSHLSVFSLVYIRDILVQYRAVRHRLKEVVCRCPLLLILLADLGNPEIHCLLIDKHFPGMAGIAPFMGSGGILQPDRIALLPGHQFCVSEKHTHEQIVISLVYIHIKLKVKGVSDISIRSVSLRIQDHDNFTVTCCQNIAFIKRASILSGDRHLNAADLLKLADSVKHQNIYAAVIVECSFSQRYLLFKIIYISNVSAVIFTDIR